MPRGVKKTTAYLLAEIDAKIEKKQKEMRELQNQRKELENARQAEVAAKIIQAANEKGISVDDILASIEAD